MRQVVLLLSSSCIFAASAQPALAQHLLHHWTDAVELRYARSQPVLSYTLKVDSTDLSGFSVELRIRNAADTVRLGMMAHPEYDDRFWRYVENLEAEGPHGATIARQDSALWRLIAPGGESVVRYRIHLPPPEQPPRAGWRPFLTASGGLVGGPHSFMYLVGATLAPAHVALDLPASWTISTGLEPTFDPHIYLAPSAFVLMDSPMLVGRLRSWNYEIDGVPHRVVYWSGPNAVPFDTVALVDGFRKLSQQAVAIFGRPPYREYSFQLQDNAQGALEHLNSVSIGAPSEDLAKGLDDLFDEASHEYFHTWNLMRLRPAEYGDVSYRPPPRSRGLWWSEGITIYYADLMLRRAGLPTFEPTRIAHLEQAIARYLSRPGQARFSAESISVVAYGTDPGGLGDYDASVHLEGEILGTMLDLTIRDATNGRRSLADLIRLLFERFSGERGFIGADIEQAAHEICGCPMRAFFDRYVRTGHSVDFDRYLALAGLRARATWNPVVDSMGTAVPDRRIFTWQPDGEDGVALALSDPASVWGKAGLHSGDRIVEVNGVHPKTPAEFRDLRSRFAIGDSVRIEISRKGVSHAMTVLVTGFQRPQVQIEDLPDPTEKQRKIREAWVSGEY